uniref:dUTPase-like domain-containing protein n=1 Tax=viral metagenome TaxID=1070528 RepID=A0A6C0I366_9ZZZZ
MTDYSIQATYLQLKNKYASSSANFAILKIHIPNNNLNNEYDVKVTDHNLNFIQKTYMDSGFDLFVPNKTVFTDPFATSMVDLGIKAEMIYCDVTTDHLRPSPFYVYPRSSMSKTPLMLANHTGIIDSGYRGSLIAAFRYLGLPTNNNNNTSYTVDPMTRLVQICHPTLCPIFVTIVPLEQLSETERGSGGFGSTGK